MARRRSTAQRASFNMEHDPLGTYGWKLVFLLVTLAVNVRVVGGLLSLHPIHKSVRHRFRVLLSRDALQPPTPSTFENAANNHMDLKSSLPPLEQAIREATIDENEATRVFHGRGGVFEGCEHVTLDWFPPVWLLTSHHIELSPGELMQVQQALEQRFLLDLDNNNAAPVNLVFQHRAANSSRANTRLLSGSVPEPHVVVENGMNFSIGLLQGQNQGIFLDMKNGREWVRRNSNGKTVLNLFAYTCGFSIAALMGGASQVINIDMVRGCLKTGQRNHELNNFPSGSSALARFLAHDIFKSWGKIRKLGPYGLIVVDPPSFQKGSFVAKDDYHKIIRRLPGFLDPEGGLVMLCLNAPELDSEWLQGEVAKVAPELEFVKRLENPRTFPAKDEERALKVLIYRTNTTR